MGKKKKIIIFASGTKDGGGSGFENMVNATQSGILNAEISAVISNHENGGVREKADRLSIKFIHFPKPWTTEKYQELTEGADLVCLSGWLKLVAGLDPKKTINIHPGDPVVVEEYRLIIGSIKELEFIKNIPTIIICTKPGLKPGWNT